MVTIKAKPKVKIRSIEKAITRLIHNKSFYATIVAGLTRRAVPDFICKTLAVVCNPETYLGIELIYNQKFIESIEDMEFFEFVVEHECVHLLLEHIQRYWTDKRLKKIDHDTFNIGADMATNVAISKHYPGLEGKISKDYWMPEKMKLPPDRAMEVYTLMIDAKRDKEGKKKNMFNKQAVNPHLWGFKIGKDSNGNPVLVPVNQKEQKQSGAKQEMNLPEFVKQAVNSYTKNQGTLPSYVQDMISGFIKLKKGFSWQELLLHKVASGMPSFRKRSIMRCSRRLWGIPAAWKFPGKTTDRAYKVCLIIDTSGSMGQDDLKAAASTLKSLMDHYKNVSVWVVHADTRVVKTQQLKDINEFDFNVYGRGGTDFIVPIQHVEKEIRPDIICYFTDGYGRAPDKAPKASIVWFISEGGQNPVKHLAIPYGEVVDVKYR